MSTTTTTTSTNSTEPLAPGQRIASRPLKRMLLGQTAVDFWGGRKRWFVLSLVLIAISAVSLSTRWLNLSIDFEGGIVFDVPAESADGFTVDGARGVLSDNGVDGSNAKVERRRSSSGAIIKVQIPDAPDEVRDALQVALAADAEVSASDVSVSAVSATWGSEITRKAVIALAVFIGLLAIVISIRFEWRMALSAIIAMLHDVVIAAGIYSVFGFEVTPPTVVAFLTILGYSLYDTVVLFDRVRENERRILNAGHGPADLVNVSTNQMVMRSLNTSVSSLLPVVALLLIGTGLLGQVTLREFALALFVGMAAGAYSSVFVATPLLGWFKGAGSQTSWLTGDDLRHVVVRGVGVLAGRTPRTTRTPRRREPAPATAAVAPSGGDAPRSVEASTEQLLSHPPRPRKKKRH